MAINFQQFLFLTTLILMFACGGPSTRGLKMNKYVTCEVKEKNNRNNQSSKSSIENSCGSREPVQWAVVVGINDYRDQKISDLSGAVPDAWTFYHYLTSPFGSKIPQDRAILLLNEKATRANVEGAFGNIKACPNDVVILYFAGHGMPEPNSPENAFLLMHDTDLNNMVGTAISMQKLPEFLSWRLNDAGKLLMIIDACHSGNIQFANNTRGLKLNTADKAKEEATRIRSVNQNLKKMSDQNKRWAVISAAAMDELAEESSNHCKIDNKSYPGGVFTCNLINGLTGLADKNRDQNLTFEEVYQYLTKRVEQDTSGKQVPQASGGLNHQEELFLALSQSVMIPKIPKRYLETKKETNTIKPFKISSMIVSGLSLSVGLVFNMLTESTAQDINSFENQLKTRNDYQSLQDSYDFQKSTSTIAYGTAITTALISSGLWYYEYSSQDDDLHQVYQDLPWFELRPPYLKKASVQGE